MRFLYFVLFLSLLLSPGLSAKSPEKAAPIREHVMANAEEHALSSSITGRRYRIYIGYPASYNRKSSKKYPVVYVTDGNWNFDRLCSIAPGLWLDGVAPEFIVVGIGYDDDSLDFTVERRYELTPTQVDDDEARQSGVRTGGAHKFLNSIRKEIIPYVEAHANVDPAFRVLAGSSLGDSSASTPCTRRRGRFKGLWRYLRPLDGMSCG